MRSVIRLLSVFLILLCASAVVDASDLIPAAKFGDVKRLQRVIDQKPDLNAIDSKGNTALFLAASRGHLKAATMLVDAGADINYVHHGGHTALLIAILNKKLKVASMLIERGADVNHLTSGYQDSPLLWAASQGMAKLIPLLINKGADINHYNEPGYTALHIAVLRADIEVVRALIESGIDLNAKSRNGGVKFTPLVIAVSNKNRRLRAIAKLLIESGADVNTANSLGETPLVLAVGQKNPVMVALLLEKGANPNSVQNNGQTPLFWATRIGNDKVVEQLLKHGADPEIRDNNNKRAIDFANKYRVKKLLNESQASLIKASSE